MNERLSELYRACRPKEALVSQDEYKAANVLLGTEIEKFAELIVKECIELNKQELAFNAFERMLNRYKEHFGVEE
jgi:hypothetical protein